MECENIPFLGARCQELADALTAEKEVEYKRVYLQMSKEMSNSKEVLCLENAKAYRGTDSGSAEVPGRAQ